MSFEIEGLAEFIKNAEGVIDKWDEKKQVLLTRCALAINEEVTPLIPVDTDRLRASFQVGVVTPDYAEVGTNVHYALYVNDGHVQHRRALPVSYISAKGKRKYLSDKNQKFIMLKEGYVPGVHFLEKGMTAAEPRIKRIGESWMRELAKEIEGGK